MTRRLMEGSEAIAEAAIAAGCRFFAGYPMTPFTELLESFAKKLPGVGGVCVNAESELESIGMAWGALATGARAATGSTGQGIALMQESLSEITRAELPSSTRRVPWMSPRTMPLMSASRTKMSPSIVAPVSKISFPSLE